MVNEFVELSPKSNDSKREEEESVGARDLEYIYRSTPRCGKYQEQVSNPSDDETTSSSLIPLPDSLNKMRNELKRTINNIADSPVNPPISTKFAASLEELKKKYSMSKEAAVAMKMNSVNTMLDDLLSKNTKEIPQQDFDSSIADESTISSSLDRCKCGQFITHPVGANVCNFTKHPCFMHDSTCCPSYNYVNSSSPKRDQISIGKKRSFFERIQDFQVKDKIQAVYRSMNKSRFRNKVKKEDEESLGFQGIPPPYECSEVTKRRLHDDCDMCQPTHHKRVINMQPRDPHPVQFVYTAYPVDDQKCTCSKQDLKCTCPPNSQSSRIRCTCPGKLVECTCPTRKPVCTCSSNEIKSTCTTKFRTRRIQTEPEIICAYGEIQRDDQDLQKKPSRRKSEEPCGDNVDDKSLWEVPSKVEKVTQTSGERLKSPLKNIPEKIDVYYFDHGNSAYYKTTDNHPAKFTEYLVEKTDRYANKFWAEIFGTIQVAFAFVTSFILQLYRFLFTSIIRSLTVGLLQIFSDYFFKPLLTILFNGIIQPILILAYNIATSFKDLCEPISQTCGFFIRELAQICRACRLVEVNQNNCKNPSCTCNNKL